MRFYFNYGKKRIALENCSSVNRLIFEGKGFFNKSS